MTECWMTSEFRVKTPFGKLASPSGDPELNVAIWPALLDMKISKAGTK
jgi:hypothetical protein